VTNVSETDAGLVGAGLGRIIASRVADNSTVSAVASVIVTTARPCASVVNDACDNCA